MGAKRMSQRENRVRANSHDRKDVNSSYMQYMCVLRIALNVRDDVRRDNIYYTANAVGMRDCPDHEHVIVRRRRGTSSACRSMTYVCIHTDRAFRPRSQIDRWHSLKTK